MVSESLNGEKACWQYEVRKKNLINDSKSSGLSEEEIGSLKLSDFEFSYVPSSDHIEVENIKQFIIRHEWLGKMPARPTQRFVAMYKGEIAGVIVLATPNAFSHLLGKENKDKEKLISRGACISWSPKGLASWLISRSIDWMVKNTTFRFFTAYADTEANEMGTIYQACNFIYLGKKSGTRFEFYDSNNPQRGWFSDRLFRKVGQYKKYAKEHRISWDSSWSIGCKIQWENVPKDIQAILKDASKHYQSQCLMRHVPPKHKYVLIKGRSKKETKKLLEDLYDSNPQFKPLSSSQRPGIIYPKIRGQ